MDADLCNMPVSYKGVSLPHAQLIWFDPQSGNGAIRLSPGGVILEVADGKLDKPPEPYDADSILKELEIKLQEYGY